MTPKLTLAPLSDELAPEPAREILSSTQKKQGFVPNMYREMAHAPGVLDTYLHGMEWFRKDSGFTLAEQEVVLLVISRDHGCRYCVAAHSMIAQKVSRVPAQALDAVRQGRAIDDPRLEALAAFTSEMMQSQGTPSDASVQAFRTAGFSEQQALQIVLALAMKTMSNFTNHLFDTPIDPAFASYAPSAAS